MSSRDPDGAAGRDVAVVVLVLAVLGVLAGVLWAVVVTPAEFTKVPGGASMSDDQLGRQFGADGWYAVIGAVTALVTGAVVVRWRARDLVRTSAALVLGSVVAAVAMAVTGHLLGPGDPRAALAAAKVGALVPERLDVGVRPLSPLAAYVRGSLPVYLSWPFGALLGALLVLVGRSEGGDAPADFSDDSDKSPGRLG